MLQQVETSVDDPIITDNTVMTRAEKRFSAYAYCVLVLTCRGKALQVIQRVPRGFGFEAWRQLCEELEPRPPAKSQEMCQAFLSPAKSGESMQQESRLEVCGGHPGDKVSVPQPGRPIAWDLSHQEATECLRASRMCKTSGTDPTDLASLGEEEDGGSVKLKKHFNWWEPEHNENECRNSPSGPDKKCDRYRIGQCAAVEENPESSSTELSGEKGAGVLSHAAGQDACLLHEKGSDQSMYSCPSPTDEGGDNLENMAASPPLQVWFDTEVSEALESHNLDVVATTEQHSKTVFRPDVQIEPPEEVPDNSELIASVETRKVENEFAVRNVTELIVDGGQQGSAFELSMKNRETIEKQT